MVKVANKAAPTRWVKVHRNKIVEPYLSEWMPVGSVFELEKNQADLLIQDGSLMEPTEEEIAEAKANPARPIPTPSANMKIVEIKEGG